MLRNRSFLALYFAALYFAATGAQAEAGPRIIVYGLDQARHIAYGYDANRGSWDDGFDDGFGPVYADAVVYGHDPAREIRG